jgi:hypothetical protein
MEVSFIVSVKLPDVNIERITIDALGNTDIVLSAGGLTAKCQIDADGSDYGSIYDALLCLAGIHIDNVYQRPCYTVPPVRRVEERVQ